MATFVVDLQFKRRFINISITTEPDKQHLTRKY